MHAIFFAYKAISLYMIPLLRMVTMIMLNFSKYNLTNYKLKWK